MNENLEQQFAKIRENRVEFNREELPENVELPFDEEFTTQRLLELATSFWERIYNPQEFKQALKNYMLQGTDEERQAAVNEKKYFKRIRKAGLIYKSAYRFGEEGRNLPENFDNFLKKLGELGDYFFYPSGREVAFEVLQFLVKDDFKLPDENPTFSTPEVAIDRVYWIVDRCQGFLADGVITIHEFHKMRKLMRHVMNLYQLAAVAKADDLNVQQTFQYICDLNSLLGDEHDEAVQNDAKGISNYDEQEVVVNKPMEEKLVVLLGKLEKAIAKSRNIGEIKQE